MGLIKLKNVSKFYHNKTTVSSGFSKVSLDIDIGEFVVITGESGSGKSTLLNVISGLDSYEEGEMYINGEETSHYTEVDYENYRRKYIGNIFQNFNLVNSYTVYQNVELVLLLNGYRRRDIKQKVLDIIKTVGLTKYKNTKASKLSGGQKQRVAIARALAKDTPIIVADEPTGNLDVQSAKSIMKLLSEISKNKLVVIVTHNYEQVEEYATRKISMNDGKIIEDKRLHTTEKIEPELITYKDLTNLNKVRLGIRNAFNIKTKFVLLFLVYFFLTILVFSEYASLSNMAFKEDLKGINNYFNDASVNRVVMNKKDRLPFTEDEISLIGALANVESVEPTDLILDLAISAYSDDTYFYGKVKNLKELDKVDYGVLPSNDDEIVIATLEDSYYLYSLDLDNLHENMTLQNSMSGREISKATLTGIKTFSRDDEDIDRYGYVIIYISDTMMDKLKLDLDLNYSKINMTIEDRIYNSSTDYFNVRPNERVPEGEAFITGDLSMYCKDYTCLNKKVSIGIENIYFEDSKELTIRKILDKNNFTSATNLKNYDENTNTIFVNESDYKTLVSKGNYQISVFLSDIKEGDETVSKLKSMGYNTYYMKNLLVDPTAELGGVVKIIRNIVFMIATVTLFFISYLIIRIILKSRNVYFSTIRILGSTKRVAKQLLDIELFVDITIAYLVFLALAGLVYAGVIDIEYINDIIVYLTLRDYVLVYIILSIMSFLISTRFAHKLFVDSVMKTYREEV